MPQQKGFFSTIFGLNDEIDANNEVEIAQRKLLDAQRESGKVTQREYQRLLDVSELEDVEAAARDEFVRDVGHGLNDAKKAAERLLLLALVVGLIYAAWQFGLFKKLGGFK